ncbi:DUF58 domain-containing protein [Kineococcus sp. SYSU DK003]|uniref:DUF58 domain-containing protein n=1 Tax=Kineococcus sp. SYSU DK003 TaxID=3383124 RepID=UPI003D7DF497
MTSPVTAQGQARFVADPVPGRRLGLRSVLPATAGPALLVLSFGVGNRWLTLVACLLTAALGVALATGPRIAALAVSVRVPARCRVGDVVEHVVQVGNTAARATPPMVLRLRGDAFEEVHLGLPAIAAGDVVELRVPRTARVRSASAGPAVVVEGADALGLRVRRRGTSVPAATFVHPAPSAVPVAPAPPARAGAEEVAGVRPFRAGDPASAVHWRASARRGLPAGPHGGSLVVVERQAAPTGLLVLVPVAGRAGEAFEELVSQAAALVAAERAAGRPVAVVDAQGRAREGVQALDALAGAEPAPLGSRGAVAARVAGRNGRVLVGDGGAWRVQR